MKQNKTLVNVAWWHIQPKKQGSRKREVGVNKIWERGLGNIGGRNPLPTMQKHESCTFKLPLIKLSRLDISKKRTFQKKCPKVKKLSSISWLSSAILMYWCMYVFMYVCMYVCMCVCVCACVCVCVCVCVLIFSRKKELRIFDPKFRNSEKLMFRNQHSWDNLYTNFQAKRGNFNFLDPNLPKNVFRVGNSKN